MSFIFKNFLPYCKIFVCFFFFLPPLNCKLLEARFFEAKTWYFKRILVDYSNDNEENNEIKAIIYYSV